MAEWKTTLMVIGTGIIGALIFIGSYIIIENHNMDLWKECLEVAPGQCGEFPFIKHTT